MEGYVQAARESTIPSSKGPVRLNREEHVPVVPMNRWVFEDKKRLRKCFVFENVDDRNQFLFQVIQYESLKKHYADIRVSEKVVEVCVQTKNLDSVGDIDKEFARTCDVIYKDINAPVGTWF